jgi:hypothetical protein
MPVSCRGSVIEIPSLEFLRGELMAMEGDAIARELRR